MEQKENSQEDFAPGTAAENAGKILDGKYLLLEELGRGAYGVVFKAKHLVLEQIVAVKIIDRSCLESEAQIKRFHNEAAVLSSLSHPKIVRFISYGKLADNRHYMALEYVEGQNLQQLLRQETALKQEQALPVFIDLADALSYLHENGIVHRDIKPANLALSPSENGSGHSAKLIDFGIAKDLDQSSQGLTKTGAVLGTVAYMSPEQCCGQKLDGRSDLYSFACLMYETLCGKAPMSAENELLTMSNHINLKIDEVPAKFGIDSELERILLKCLSKAPDERIQTASELKSRLEGLKPAPSKRTRRARLLLPNSISFAIIVLALMLFAGLAVFLKARQSDDASGIKVARTVTLLAKPPTECADIYTGYLALDKWLEGYLSGPHPNEKKLVSALERYESWRQALALPGPNKYCRQIEILVLNKKDQLRQSLEKAKHSPNEQKQILRDLGANCSDLALVQVVAEKESEARETLELGSASRKFSNYGIAELGLRVGAIVNIEIQKGRYEEAARFNAIHKTLIDKDADFQNYASCLSRKMELHRYMGQRKAARAAALELRDFLNRCFAEHSFVRTPELNSYCQMFKALKLPEQAVEVFLEYKKKAKDQIEIMDDFDYNLASAYICNSDYENAFKLLSPLFSPALKDGAKKVRADLAFNLYLNAQKERGKNCKEEITKFMSELEKLTEIEKLRSMTCIADVYCQMWTEKEKDFFDILESKVEKLLKKFPGKGSVLLACLQARNLELGYLSRIKELDKALTLAKESEKEALAALKKEPSRGVMDLLSLNYQLQFDQAGMRGDLAEVEEIFKRAGKQFGKLPEFDLALEVRYANQFQSLEPEKTISILSKLFDSCQAKSVSQLSSYYNCAYLLAQTLAKESRNTEAIDVLKRACKKSEEYRAAYSGELLSYYKLMRDYSEKAGDRSSFKLAEQRIKELKDD